MKKIANDGGGGGDCDEANADGGSPRRFTQVRLSVAGFGSRTSAYSFHFSF